MLHDAEDDDNKCAGRAADLIAAAAQQRNKKAGNNRRVQSLRRRDARGYRKRHGQRNGDDGNGQSGNTVAFKFIEIISFMQSFDQFRGEIFQIIFTKFLY